MTDSVRPAWTCFSLKGMNPENPQIRPWPPYIVLGIISFIYIAVEAAKSLINPVLDLAREWLSKNERWID